MRKHGGFGIGIYLTLALSLAFGGSVCAFALGADAAYLAETLDGPEILSLMASHSGYDSLLQNHDRVQSTTYFQSVDGSVQTILGYAEGDRRILEVGSDVIVCEGGECFGYSKETMAPFQVFFVGYGEGYPAFLDPTVFQVSEQEAVARMRVSGEDLLVGTAIRDQDYVMDLEEYFGYDYTEGDYLLAKYYVSPLDFAILDATVQLFQMDGTEEWVYKSSLDFEPGRFTVPEEIEDCLESPNRRTLTVVTDGGTYEEERWVFRAATGIGFRILADDLYDTSILYADEGFTRKAVDDRVSDLTVYLAERSVRPKETAPGGYDGENEYDDYYEYECDEEEEYLVDYDNEYGYDFPEEEESYVYDDEDESWDDEDESWDEDEGYE